jgi:transcription elongation factor Elf1
MATKRCPFCGNSAVAKSVGDAYNLDCGFCDIRIEISKAAYAIPCADVEGVLEIVRARMERGGSRPRIDRAAMQKTTTEAKGIDQ